MLAAFLVVSRHALAAPERLNPTPEEATDIKEARVIGRQAWAQRQREHDPQIANLRFLWGGYKPKYWWFEVFEMLRKFLMIGMPIAIALRWPNNPYLQMAYGLVTMALTTAVQAIGDPYIEKADAVLVLPAQFEVFLSLVAGMIVDLSGGDAGSTKVGVSVVMLAVGVPVTAMLLFSVVAPDRANAWMARAKQRGLRALNKKGKLAFDKLGCEKHGVTWDEH